MKPARILLLVVAILAGGLAAFLATRGDAPTQKVAEVKPVREAVTKVLVAKDNIGVGQRLTPEVLQWQDWPDGAVRPQYVSIQKVPDAPDQLKGTIARFAIFAGEPITEAKLVKSDQGYLSAVLARGMRAVSLQVTARSAAGGFIVPNDRVDLVQTIKTPQGRVTQVLLENVKVLAIGHRLGETGTTGGTEPKPQQGLEDNSAPDTFADKTIATLEVTPQQAKAVIGASDQADLSLALRSILDYSQPVTLLATGKDAGQVRMIRFGQSADVSPVDNAAKPIETSSGGSGEFSAASNTQQTPVVVRPAVGDASGDSSTSSTASDAGGTTAAPPKPE